MKIHRFIGAFRLDTDRITVQDPDLVHHMGRVLRLRVGESVVLCNGKGQEIQGNIESLDKRSVVINVEERRANTVEPEMRLTLYLALIKRENFELALQKVTEVGVSEVVPLHTSRTVKTKTNLERLQAIAREAAEQSGRGVVPNVHEPRSFKEVCEELKGKKNEVFFADTATPLSAPLSYRLSEKKEAQAYSLLIGPEGGWSDEERTLARLQGFAIVNLGPRILRAETAAIVASYLLLA